MVEDETDEIKKLIVSTIERTGSSSFMDTIKDITAALGGRKLTLSEKLMITQVIKTNSIRNAELERTQDSYYQNNPSSTCDDSHFDQILIVTAYTSDYTIGHVCSQINKDYANTHGYEFISKVLTLDAITTEIYPKKHCTWYKILILKQLMADKEYLRDKQIRYIMWIDADALVINHAQSMRDIISRGQNRDLIIAEDMNPGCLLNCGVFLLRVTNWSVSFLDSVWSNDKYNSITFYEQSTIIRHFKTINEGLDAVLPFHSYSKGNSLEMQQAVKLFAHVAVLPCRELNTNKGVSVAEVAEYRARSPFAVLLGPTERRVKAREIVVNNISAVVELSNSDSEQVANVPLCEDFSNVSISSSSSRFATTDNNPSQQLLEDSAQFIYHVAGMRDKLGYILTAVDKHGLRLDDETSRNLRPFHLYRGKNGQILPQELVKSRKLEIPV